MTLVSAELFDQLQPLALARTDAFRKWLDCGVKQAKNGQGRNRQYKRLADAYKSADEAFRAKLPSNVPGNLSLPLHLADIETLHAAGDRFKDLSNFATEAYANHMGYSPPLSTPIVHRHGAHGFIHPGPVHVGHLHRVGWGYQPRAIGSR